MIEIGEEEEEEEEEEDIRPEQTIQRCCDTFPTLTHFYIQSYIEYETEIYKSFKFISNLKNLKHFYFNKFDEQNTKLFCHSLKRMANKCQNLKSIECHFDISADYSNIRQLLSPFQALPALKRLNLALKYTHFVRNDLKRIFFFRVIQRHLEYHSFDSCFLLE